MPEGGSPVLVHALVQDAVDRAADEIAESTSGEDDLTEAQSLLELAAKMGIVPTPIEDAEGEVVLGPDPDPEPEAEVAKEPATAEPEPEAAETPPEATGGQETRHEAPEEVALVVPAEVADEVGKALALRERAASPTNSLPTPDEYHVLGLLANRTYETTFVPAAYRGREADVFAAFLFGREIGLGPMMALRDVHMIDGRPALAAHRQLAKLREGGVIILESTSTAEVASITARRSDTGEVMTVAFTMAEAKIVVDKSGKHLVDKPNWRSWPADMLWARCVGRLTRRLGPDLLGGLPPYVAEEVADFSGWGVEYGDGDELAFREGSPGAQSAKQQPVPEYRKEYPDYNWPTGIPEILERLGALIGGEKEAAEWLGQAREALFPGVASADMNKDQRRLLFQKLSSVLAQVDSHGVGDLLFDPKLREFLRVAFASRLDGAVLDGPPWRISPDEDRPLKTEWAATQAQAQAESSPGAQGAQDAAEDAPVQEPDPADEIDIPFGRD